MPVGLLSLTLQIPGCLSLKDKRSRVKPLIARLHREFNISAAEMDRLDAWDETLLGCAVVGNETAHCQRVLQQVIAWVEQHWPDVTVIEQHIEVL